MKTTLFAVAAVAALGLAACQPAAETTDATSADMAGADASAMAPADPAATGAMSPDAGAATPGMTPPANGMSGTTGATGTAGTMNPDGSMSNGAVNPASPPPVTSPDSMGSTPPAQ